MIKKITLCLLLLSWLVSVNTLKAQTTYDIIGKDVATPPNAAAFTQYAKVPVGEFTGIPDIKIPLYNIKVDNFSMPIYLSYYAKGVQPNVHSGWVGTGWSLVANGVINRKINGLPDEYSNDYGANTPPAGPSKYGWYFGANHSQNYTVNQVIGNVVQVYSQGSASTSYIDTAPDEFDFSINGLSGAFFMGEDGNWKVRSASGETIKIQETFGSVTIQPLTSGRFDSQVINPTFIQFVLTTGNGTRYIFGGGATSGNPNTSIDFNRRGPSNGSYNNNLTAVAWHITEIDLPSGQKILYNYFRNGSLYTYSPVSSNSYVHNYAPNGDVLNGNATDEADFNMNVMDPVYLQSISYPEGKLIFNASLSGETDNIETEPVYLPCLRDAANGNASHSPDIVNAYNIYLTYDDLGNNYSYNSQGNINSIWYELNNIQQFDYNGNKIKQITFGYSQDANTRLFLQSVQDSSLPPYTFTYNSLTLPMYCTLHTDHWGFYNGPKAVPAFAFDGNGFVTTAFQNSYYQFREPDTSYVKAGILTQVNYPTGGYTKFFYETNQYSKWVGLPVQLPLSTASATQFGGGLRVKKIISTDNANLTPVTYEYSYVNDLTNNVSSGVLGMPKPNYAENDQVSYVNYDSNGNPIALNEGVNFGFWGTNTIYPSQNDDGNIVTYSNVIERQSNNGVYNGMKVSVFANHDNGYSNNNPDAVAYSLNSGISLFNYSDRSFERGMLLSETTYGQNNNTVKTIQNTYNNDPNRFNLCIKGIYSTFKDQAVASNASSGQAYLYFVNNSAIRFFTFYPYLQQTVEKDYPSDGTTNYVTATTNYYYDPTYDGFNGTKNLVQTLKLDSKGQILISKTKFPLDYNLSNTVTTGDPFTLGIQNLQNPNLYAVSLPVESISQVSNADGSNLRTLSATLNSYDAHFPYPNLTYKAFITNPANSFTPSSISVASGQGALNKDNTYEAREYIDNFDAVGNILQSHIVNGPNQSYQWGYNNNYLVAIVKNATNTLNTAGTTGYKDFFYDSFEEGDGNSTLRDAKTGGYSYVGTTVPFSRTVNHIDNGFYTLTYWSETSGVWTFHSQPVTVSGNSYSINISGQIDDVRLFPVTAQMTTYTYGPLVGITSATDTKGEITYYEYDALQRLINIKDKDQNIIKNITYHYQGDPAPNNSGISLENVTGTAITLNFTLPSSAPTTSSILQYTDTTTGQVYTYTIPANQTQTTIVVPNGGRSYSFVIVQNLTSGQQHISSPFVVNVVWNN